MLRNFRQVFKGNQTPMAVVMMVVLLGMVAYLAPTSGNVSAPDNVLARVYGRDITKRDLDETIARIARQFGRNANLEQMRGRLQEQALGELIGQRLREELAERHGIVVTDAEVAMVLEGYLKANPMLLDEQGQLLPPDKINTVLMQTDQPTTLKTLEQQVREELALRKLVDRAAAQVPVDQAWIEAEHRVRDEKVSFEMVSVSPDPKPVADPGDAQLQAFLKASGARFQSGPRRVLQYVAVDPSSLALPKPEDAQLRQSYESHRAQFQEYRVRQILLKVPSEDQAAEVMRKAAELKVKLNEGADFAKLADASTEDASGKGHGGEYGWFGPGRMPKPFADATAALKPGEVSQPVKTTYGVHLIQLEEKREKPFEEVKEELRAQLQREMFTSKAKDVLEKLRKRAGERGDLAGPARNLGLKMQVSKPLAEGEMAGLEGLPGSEMVAVEAFAMKVGQVSKVRPAGAAFVVSRVQEELPVAVPPLAEIRARVLDAWKLEQARKALAAKAAGAAGDLKVLGVPETRDNVTISALAELGQHPAIRKALLDTPAGKTTPAIWGPDGKLWMARIKERTPAAPLTFETRHALVLDLQAQTAQGLLTAEMRALYAAGQKRPGFSSFNGRYSGIYRNEELLAKILGDSVDSQADFE